MDDLITELVRLSDSECNVKIAVLCQSLLKHPSFTLEIWVQISTQTDNFSHSVCVALENKSVGC